MINMVKLPTKNKRMFLRVARGHFATSHSHINYYIDATMQKNRLSEAAEAARELVHMYKSTTIVDTVLCLDGTQVIGTCLANELTKDGFRNMNAHQTIYIITPEYTSGSQIILRDNIAPMVRGKHVLILAASITTGYTMQAAIEAVQYSGPAHRRACEQLRLFGAVKPSPSPDRGLLPPLSSRGLSAPPRKKRPPGDRGSS